eukprot:TRINITY_DN35817_c0_g1_i1.p1 TRINITY_DN35817_c0_g1~~TRINITY_DN35817_c0_g1_i1.p1  ORF type:complete len:549 (+),score=37.29 TRINITY_DN35817_c0_g1_i1:146-1792(+)
MFLYELYYFTTTCVFLLTNQFFSHIQQHTDLTSSFCNCTTMSERRKLQLKLVNSKEKHDNEKTMQSEILPPNIQNEQEIPDDFKEVVLLILADAELSSSAQWNMALAIDKANQIRKEMLLDFDQCMVDDIWQTKVFQQFSAAKPSCSQKQQTENLDTSHPNDTSNAHKQNLIEILQNHGYSISAVYDHPQLDVESSISPEIGKWIIDKICKTQLDQQTLNQTLKFIWGIGQDTRYKPMFPSMKLCMIIPHEDADIFKGIFQAKAADSDEWNDEIVFWNKQLQNTKDSWGRGSLEPMMKPAKHWVRFAQQQIRDRALVSAQKVLVATLYNPQLASGKKDDAEKYVINAIRYRFVVKNLVCCVLSFIAAIELMNFVENNVRTEDDLINGNLSYFCKATGEWFDNMKSPAGIQLAKFAIGLTQKQDINLNTYFTEGGNNQWIAYRQLTQAEHKKLKDQTLTDIKLHKCKKYVIVYDIICNKDFQTPRNKNKRKQLSNVQSSSKSSKNNQNPEVPETNDSDNDEEFFSKMADFFSRKGKKSKFANRSLGVGD